jgi:hypothetical protein
MTNIGISDLFKKKKKKKKKKGFLILKKYVELPIEFLSMQFVNFVYNPDLNFLTTQCLKFQCRI